MSAAAGKSLSILIADDEVGFRDLFTFCIAPQGFEIMAVEDGLQAVRAVEERPFSLVVLDVHMPHMGGPEALARIRAIRPEQRVIVMSSSSDPSHEFESSAGSLGARACLFKPVELDELLATIMKAIGEQP